MQINSLPKSNITEAKPAAEVKPVVAPKPEEKKPVVAKAPVEVKKEEPKKEDIKPTSAKDTVITDVKATGDANAKGEPTFTLKVNGKDVVATQSQIIALAQKAQGAEAAMKQKAEVEKLAANMLSNFDNDAYGLLVQRHGAAKAKEIAVNMVRKLIEEEQRDPKDVEIERLKKFEESSKAEKEAIAKKEEDAKKAANQKKLYGDLLRSIDQELNNTSLPKDKLTLTRVLNFLSAGKKANGETWTVKDAVQAVETEDMGHASYYAKQYVEGKLPSEKFRSIFGEEAFKKLNKEQIDSLKKADKVAKVEAKKEEKVEEAKPKKSSLSKNKGTEAISEREWRKLGNSMGGI